jgi:hypothetical protein
MTPSLDQSQPTALIHVLNPAPRKDHRGVDFISEVLPFGRLHALRRTALCD